MPFLSGFWCLFICSLVHGIIHFCNVICMHEFQVMSFSPTHFLTRKLTMVRCGKLRERSVGCYIIYLVKLHLITIYIVDKRFFVNAVTSNECKIIWLFRGKNIKRNSCFLLFFDKCSSYCHTKHRWMTQKTTWINSHNIQKAKETWIY